MSSVTGVETLIGFVVSICCEVLDNETAEVLGTVRCLVEQTDWHCPNACDGLNYAIRSGIFVTYYYYK